MDEKMNKVTETATEAVLGWYENWQIYGMSWEWCSDSKRLVRSESYNHYSTLGEWLQEEMTGEYLGSDFERYIDRLSRMVKELIAEALIPPDYEGEDWIEDNFEQFYDFVDRVVDRICEIPNEPQSVSNAEIDVEVS